MEGLLSMGPTPSSFITPDHSIYDGSSIPEIYSWDVFNLIRFLVSVLLTAHFEMVEWFPA